MTRATGIGSSSQRRRSPVRPLVRWSIYVAVLIALFLLRGRPELQRLARPFAPGAAADTALVVAGTDLAPALAERLLEHYRRDYPRLAVQARGGGTAAALEDLVNGRADAAFLSRPPLPEEQSLIAGAGGDTALWFPIALGAIVVVTAADAPESNLTVDRLRALAAGEAGPGAGPLYVPDPNNGLWDALRAKLGLPPAGTAAPAGVIFLRDEATVAAAVAAAPGAFGAASSFALRGAAAPPGARVVPLRAGPGQPAVPPGREEIAAGTYPLWHYLYVGCRPGGGAQGAKFVTHLTSPRGQRQIERTEYLPARQVPREILLNRGSPGA